MEQIVILGVGGFGREVHELVEDINLTRPSFEFLGFLDARTELHRTTIHGLPVLGDIDWLTNHPGVAAAIGIGSPSSKQRIARQLRAAGVKCPALIHPRATIGRRNSVGEGSIVCAGTVVTTDIVVASFVTLNLNVTVGHDSLINDFVTVAPGAHISGNVQIGSGTDLGTGAMVIPRIVIGEWSIIGAGATVVSDIPANVTAVGTPATVIKQRDPGWQLA